MASFDYQSPDPALISRITVVQDCCALAGMMNGVELNAPGYPGPIATSFYYALGCLPTTAVEIIGENPIEELHEAIREASIELPAIPAPAPAEGEDQAAPLPVQYRGASMVEKGLMRAALRFLLLSLGKSTGGADEETRRQLDAQRVEIDKLKHQLAAPQTKPANDEGSIALSQVISDTAQGTCELMSDSDIKVARRNWKRAFGATRECPEDEEPSEEQLSCLKHILATGSNPYLNFSHWGPHGNRLLRKQRLVGLVFTAQGVLSQIELVGPATFEMWQASFQVMVHAMVSLDAIDLGTLVAYCKYMTDFHKRHGERVWALQYQADVRARREHMVRVKAAHVRALRRRDHCPVEPSDLEDV